jgi:biotin carboxyl carrier protein
MKLRLAGDTHQYEVEVLQAGADRVRVRIDGAEYDGGAASVSSGNHSGHVAALHVRGVRDRVFVAIGPASFEFEIVPEQASRRRARGPAAHEVAAPMPGKVLKVLVAEGQTVDRGAPLIVLEAMKMETTLYAEGAGVIAKLHAEPGAMVDHGAVLIELGPVAPEAASQQ